MESFSRNFDSRGATGNHNAVRMFKNLINIVNTVQIFYFGNNFYTAVKSIKNLLNCLYIFFISHKWVGTKSMLFCAENSMNSIFFSLIEGRFGLIPGYWCFSYFLSIRCFQHGRSVHPQSVRSHHERSPSSIRIWLPAGISFWMFR